MTAGPDRVGHLPHIGRPVVCVREEVEDRAVVPEVEALWRDIGRRDVPSYPPHGLCKVAEPPPGVLESGLRYVKTVTLENPASRRSSTRVEVPPPTSMIEACLGRPAVARNSSERSRCGRYQLTLSGCLVA